MRVTGRKGFFFVKKKQKTFSSWFPVVSTVRTELTEVFCFFFSKKKYFLLLSLAPLSTLSFASARSLTLYSRLSFAPAVAQAFTAKTGIEVRLRRPPASGMRGRIVREGDHPRWGVAWFYGVGLAQGLDRLGLVARGVAGAYVITGMTVGAVLLAEPTAPFAPPLAWGDLLDPAYHGLVGMADPATSMQTISSVDAVLNAAGGWPGGKEAFETLGTDGLHIYADSQSTVAALRSGAIQLAIVRGSVAWRAAGLRVIVPQPATELPAVIVMAKTMKAGERAAALKFIGFAASKAGQAIAHRVAGVSAGGIVGAAMVPLDASLLEERRGVIEAWFSKNIVGRSS